MRTRKDKIFYYSVCAIVALSFIFGIAHKASSQSCNQTATFTNGSATVNVIYDYPSAGESIWFVDVTTTGGSSYKDWSHINIQLGACLTSSMFKSGGTYTGSHTSPTLKSNSCWSVGKDGSDPTKMWGIKYDCGLNKGGSYKLYFILKKNYALTSNVIKNKAGTAFDTTFVCGPDLKCGVVPVKFISISSQFQDLNVLVKWATATELNNKEFEIQRSDGHTDFKTIGVVPGAGNSSQTIQYSFIDENPLDKTAYYRIRQNDYDGKFDYSEVAEVRPGVTIKSEKITIYRVPTNTGNEFRVNAKGLGAYDNLIQVSNISGQIVFEQKFNEESAEVAIINLPLGYYTVTTYSRNFVSSKKLINL